MLKLSFMENENNNTFILSNINNFVLSKYSYYPLVWLVSSLFLMEKIGN